MNHLRAFPILVLLAVLLSGGALLLSAQAVSADPIYVDQDAAGTGDGLSWTNAFTEVQSALAAAVAGDDIWVAEGVYYPNFDPVTHVYTPSRGAWFSLPNDVRLYGGFAGDETALAQRDWAAHPTVLSGDIDRNDLTDARGVVTTTAHIVGDNAYTVLSVGYLSAASAVDGFYITGGQANGAGGNSWEPHRSGGGIYSGGGSATLRHLVVIGNYAESGGGAAIYNASMTLVNLAFLNNSAQFGGGVYNYFHSGTLTNLTLSGNSASGRGGGVYVTGGSLALVNGIVWGNSAPAGAQIDGFPTVTYSDVQDGFAGAGNIDADPLFVDAVAGDLRLQTTSPAVNAGSTAAVPADTADLDGDGDTAESLPYDLGRQARISGSAVDTGAYEMRPPLYVDRDAAGANNGSSWADAFTDLQAGLAAAAAGDELWVAEGAYLPTAGTDRTISFMLKDNVAIYGGFVATETARSQRDWTAHMTTLSGDIGITSVVTDNTYHVVEANTVSNTVLDGLTISGGYADDADAGNSFGGGMNNLEAQMTIRNVIVSDNYAMSAGGGMFNQGACDLRLVNTTFVGNSSTTGGGIMSIDRDRLALVNVLFRNNTVTGNGGGMMNGTNVTVTLTNVAFVGNTALLGGGMNNQGNEVTLGNVTFVNNTATNLGGSFAHQHGVNATLHNVILWGNTPQIYNYHSALTIAYSDIEGGCPTGATCSHVIDRDPQFVDAANGDLHLRLSSPALDAGDNTAVPTDTLDLDNDGNTSEPLPYDLGGGPRFFDAPAPDTGNGAPPLVDIGAYESTPMPIYVDKDAAGANDGSSWADAFTDLQAGLAAAIAGDELWVAEGAYLPTAGTDRAASFALKNDVAIYGGFAGTETNRDQRDWAAHVTTLSGDIGVTGVVTDNVYHVVRGTNLARSAILDGFTISGGCADGYDNDHRGGGIHNSNSDPTLRNVIITNNFAEDGGGMYSRDGNPQLINVIFVSNTALYFGGGMINWWSGRPELINTVFSGNSAARGGGMSNAYNVTSTLTGVIFYNNQASSWGGGLDNFESLATLVNVTFYGNSAGESGGGIYNDSNSQSLVSNSILWGNTAPTGAQVYHESSASTIAYSDIEGGCPAGATCSNIIDSDPQFVDAANGDLHLGLSSLALDAGDNTAVPTDTLDLDNDGDIVEPLPYDLDGGPRLFDSLAPDTGNGAPPLVDMGAYESTRTPIYVDKDAAGANNGSSWADAYTDLQSGLAAAAAGDELWVAEGAYLPGADRASYFALKNDVAVYGGFAGTETNRDQRDWTVHVTTLSGDIGATGVVTDNVYHVAVNYHLTRTAILDGFTISGGYADGEMNSENDWGGGMYTYGSSPTLRNVIFTDNYARNHGGGMFCWMASSPLLVNVAFVGNTSSLFGGGMSTMGEISPELVNVTFSNNSAIVGGGMSNADHITAKLTNVIFYNNHAANQAGGMYNNEISAAFVNVTFYGNSAGNYGGGMHNVGGSQLTISNTIFWGNTPDQLYHINSASTIAYSDIEGGCPAGAVCASGVISSAPQFVDASGGNLRLGLTSPAIDAGDNTAVPADVYDLDGDGDSAEPLPYDLGGAPRFADILSRPDTGNGTAPLVDMGAYETQDAPDVLIVKTASAASATPGQTVTYTLDFSNVGGVTATQVVITDIVPLSLTQVSARWIFPGGQITQTSGVAYTWSVSDLAPGQGGIITITGVVAASAVAGEIVNTADIAGAVDAVSGNNSSAVSIVLNGPPAAADDDYPATEDLPLSVSAPGVLGNDSDPNDDALQAAIVTLPTRGMLVFNADGSFTYTPTTNLNGVDTFTYRAGDGALWSDPAIVTITVAPVNDPPVAGDDTSNASMNTPRIISVLGNDADPDGDPLTLAAVGAPYHGAAASLGATILYTPNVGYLGEDWFTYTIADSGGLTDTATVTVLVGSINQPPVAIDDGVTTTQNTPVTIAVLSNDLNPDMDTLMVAGISAPTHGDADIQGATVVYTPALDYVGVDTFTYIVSDGQLTDTGSISVTVYDVTAPQVVAVSPLRGATGVTVTAPVVITFSEAINAAAFAYSAAPDPGGWAAAWNG
ncbi:MAG TPA: Ig-like domain-containing protein, partial [Anaerolineae bacterium]|nr:Ig-like domain-containing protein [Anaerolineae bacterium]